MATEQYANSAQTQLDGGIDASTTTLTVDSVSGFPTMPQFRIRIDNELLLVTALGGTGNKTWTVVRAYEDASRFPAVAHNSQADVTQVLTAGGLENLLPLTTQGDLLVHDGAAGVRLGVGSNGQVLTADSAEATGVKWAAGSSRIEVRFDWGDATPKTLLTVPAGKLVEKVGLHLIDPFDGMGAALTIGDGGDADRLLRAADNDPATAGVYEVRPNLEYGAPTTVNLYLTPGGGASAGSGLVILEMEQ